MQPDPSRPLKQSIRAHAAKLPGVNHERDFDIYCHDRFLCRIYSRQSAQKPTFILIGGQRMFAKVPHARETRDIDFVVRTIDLDAALEELENRASLDLADHLAFQRQSFTELGIMQDYRSGYRVVFECTCEGIKQTGINIVVDLVLDEAEASEFDVVEPINRITVPDQKTYPYAICAPEQQAAEKVCAIMQPFHNRSSSRVKDLVDLTCSMLNESYDGEKLRRAIASENRRRDMEEIDAFKIPADWHSETYKKLAAEASLLQIYSDMQRAEAAVRLWLEPVLNGDAEGLTWNPDDQSWL